MDFKKNPNLNFKDVGKLSEAEARDEIDALREGIEYHDYLYYVKDKPEISDETYDKLFRRRAVSTASSNRRRTGMSSTSCTEPGYGSKACPPAKVRALSKARRLCSRGSWRNTLAGRPSALWRAWGDGSPPASAGKPILSLRATGPAAN